MIGIFVEDFDDSACFCGFWASFGANFEAGVVVESRPAALRRSEIDFVLEVLEMDLADFCLGDEKSILGVDDSRWRLEESRTSDLTD